jgi:S1-C subfamily serine protease
VNALDWILVVVILAYAVSGYWQGFITGAFATAGLLLGGLFGIWLVPVVLGNASGSAFVSVGSLFIVLGSASLGQALLQMAGTRVRARVTWQPARALDAVGGAALSTVAVLLIVWALGVALADARIETVSPLVRNSAVLSSVDRILPASAHRALRSFTDVVGNSPFPRYLEPFATERIVDVPPGPHRLLTDPDVERAAASVVKIRGVNKCGSGVEGSGFVYAPDRVMTNAHVVAGVKDPEIITGKTSLPASVVFYDSSTDVAVLAYDGGTTKPLHFSHTAGDRDGVAILGYPGDGPYDVQTARIRSRQRLRSPDIYGNGGVLREVLSLRGRVQPGNSGGPVVSSGGEVVGVVFAASVSDNDTGYALAADQVAAAERAGKTATARVDTGACIG